MRIAISADGPDLEAKAGDRFGLSRYLVIVDTETTAFEAVPSPGAGGRRGAGIQAVVLAIGKKVDTVVTGYISPTAEGYLTTNGIEVLTVAGGTVAEILEKYKKGELGKQAGVAPGSKSRSAGIDKVTVIHALRSTVNQFAVMIPVLAGVVLFVGIVNTLVSKELISTIFMKHPALDTFWGAVLGSILAGNPINSYVIGGELLKYGLGLFPVTAFIVAWVTVGVVQLPAEIAALGKRFALVRNCVSFALSIAIAIVTVVLLKAIGG